jgi:hypothetical protein
MSYKAIIISSDDLKKTIPDYLPSKASEFHELSARMADKQFKNMLVETSRPKVILMNGGSASGKTEFMVSHLSNKNAIIVDTTLPSIEGARIKIEKSMKYNKIVELYSVMPDNLARAFTVFLHRDRIFPATHFYRTHSNSRMTLLWIARNYPHIKINIIESQFSEGMDMIFSVIKFKNRNGLIKYLEDIQLSEDAIIKATISEG